MSIEKRVGKVWLYAGANFRRLAVGFEIDRFSASIDLGIIWFSIEYWGLFNE